MMARMRSDDSLERFIRDELGCQCPAAVFRDIGVEACPASFGHWSRGCLISVGGRLLILVLYCDDAGLMCRVLGELLAEGRRLRERRGYNRFRLVIASSLPDAMAPVLEGCFNRMEGMDGRMHLHVIAAGHVPGLHESCTPAGRNG